MNLHAFARMQERAIDRASLNNANTFWMTRNGARNADPLAARAYCLQAQTDGYVHLHEHIRARRFCQH